MERMKRRHNGMMGKLAAFFGALLISGALMGVSAPAEAEAAITKSEGNTTLGTVGIDPPVVPQSRTDAWSGSFVWFGSAQYNGDQVRYRVLSANSSDFGGNTMLLDCETILETRRFNDNRDKGNAWEGSDIQAYLNTEFINSKFTPTEIRAIAESTKAASVPGDGDGWKSGGTNYQPYAPLNGGERDRIILLDAKEATRESYGYFNTYDTATNRMKTPSDLWWLRSPDSNYVDRAGCVGVGKVSSSNVSLEAVGVSPAFNMNLSSVIFSSEIKSSPDKEYKLTVSDPSLKIAVKSGSSVTKAGNVITVPYSITNDTANGIAATQVSILVTDKEILTNGDFDAAKAKSASVKQYGKLTLSGEVGIEGTGTFTLDPEKVTGYPGTDYHVYMLAEEVNGDKETDYASMPVDITTKAKVSANVVFKVEKGCWDDGTAGDKTVILSKDEDEDLALVLAPDQIPSVGNKPADGFKSGSWDTDPSTETTFRENTTTTYTYKYQEKDKISAAVTFKVVDGSWNTGGKEDITVTLNGHAGDRLKLKAGDIPETGDKPDAGFKAGSWDTAPNTTSEITKNTIYTYYYAAEDDHVITVTYEGQGTAAASKTSAKAGEKITLSAEPENGYHFKKWEVTPDTVTIKDNSFTMPDADVAVKAVFEEDDGPEPVTYTITFDPNGGSVSPTSGTTGTDGKLASLPTPEWEGHTFIGWFMEKDGGTQVTGSTVFTSNETVYAHWEKDAPSPGPEPEPPEPTPEPEPAPTPVAPEAYKAANLGGLTIGGMSLDIRLYGPRNTVSYNGRTHVAKAADVAGKRNKVTDLDIGIEGAPGFVVADFIYGKTKDASEGKAWFAARLSLDKSSASYNALSVADRKKLESEIKKANKALKKKANRVYFSIKPLDLGEFKAEGAGSGGGKAFVRKDGSGDRLVLKTETSHYIDPVTHTVKGKGKPVLHATLSGYEFKVPRKEYKKTGPGQVTGKGKNLVGTVVN